MKKIDGSDDSKQELRDYSKVILRKPFRSTSASVGSRNPDDYLFTKGTHHKQTSVYASR